MKTNVTRKKGYGALLAFCLLFWLLDSACAYFSFDYNLKQLIFREPSSLLDTILLEVPPYQVISRLMVVALFLLAGALIIEIFQTKDRAEQERSRAQQALRKSEQKYRHMVDNIPGVVYQFTLDAEGRFSFGYMGERCLDLFGVSAADIVADADTLFDLLGPTEKVETIKRIKRSAEICKPCQSEHRLTRGDGSVVWVSASSTPYRQENKEVGWDGIFVDITEPKMAEEILKQSEERFRMLLDDISMVSVQGYAADGTTRYWNEGSRLLYGYTAEEAIGRSLLDLIIPPEMREAVAEEIWKMNETGRPIPASELTLMRKDGSRVNVYSSHSLLKRSGHPPEFFCIDIDLSKIKRIEKEQEKLKAQLSQAQKLEAVGRLAGGVAHDYNNMLGVILGRAEIAMENLGENQSLAEDLREIIKAARHSADITRQLLTFARRQTVAPKVLDLNETVEATLKMIRRLIGEDIELSWHPGKNLWPLRMDPTQVDQLMANLCVNARDAIADIGKISIETRNVTLDAAAEDDRLEVEAGDYIMLAVSDTGIGMDKETKSNIFEPFFTTKADGKGTGLGLATVYGIVRQNGGGITVSSEPDAGSCFTIYLPRHAGVKRDKVVEKVGEIKQGQGEVVLLVEDEPAILELGRKMITRLGYSVIGLDSPAAAEKLVEQSDMPIDLLVTDVVLPGMNGRDLAEKLLIQRPRMKVVFMSGYTADVISDRGVLNEGVDFIQKPFTQRAMAEKIHLVLSTREP